MPCRRKPPELWWRAKHEEAKGLCRQCRAREACLDYALAADERFGIWGGRAPNERRGTA
nr:WhiB family transcriptional regulator [Klenkia marina]